MGELIELQSRVKKSTASGSAAYGPPAATFVLVPNERLSRLREFWAALKSDIAADADETPQHLIRR